MLYSYLKYTLDFGMKMPPRDGNLRGRGNHERTVVSREAGCKTPVVSF